MKVGLHGSGQLVEGLPDPGFFRAVAELAESAGYDSLWAGDHLSGGRHVIVNIGCAAGEELLDQAGRLASLLTVEVS